MACMSAGYSGTPLAKKLGIAAGDVLALLDAPSGFRNLLVLPADVHVTRSLRHDTDVVLVFVTEEVELREQHVQLAEAVFPDGAIWVAWPKRASKVATDMTEDVVRDVFLPHGLVDNKVCAIDETWSGLRVVWRKERRR
jgi:hypothetical protein